jgi:hypothetical protein
MSYERRVTSDAYSPFTTDEVLQHKTKALIWQLGIGLAPKAHSCTTVSRNQI